MTQSGQPNENNNCKNQRKQLAWLKVVNGIIVCVIGLILMQKNQYLQVNEAYNKILSQVFDRNSAQKGNVSVSVYIQKCLAIEKVNRIQVNVV